MSKKNGENIQKSEDWEDILILKEVLKTISSFISDIKGPISDLVNSVLSYLDGSKLGQDIGQFYKKLIDQGVPEEIAQKMTEDYFNRKLEMVPSLKSIIDLIASGTKKQAKNYTVEKSEENAIREAIVKLDNIKKSYPEAANAIDEVIDELRRKFLDEE